MCWLQVSTQRGCSLQHNPPGAELTLSLGMCNLQVLAASLHTAFQAGQKESSSNGTSTQVQMGDPGPKMNCMTWHQSCQHQTFTCWQLLMT